MRITPLRKFGVEREDHAMRFRLSTVILATVFVASSLAAADGLGFIVALPLLAMLWGVRLWRLGDKTGKSLFFGGLLVLVLLVAQVWMAWATVRESSRSGACRNNLKQIGLALLNYEHAFRGFPPAIVRGPDGKPWHSWRVLILRFAEEDALYKKYNFHEPWDGPQNRELVWNIPSDYRCPTVPYPGGLPPLTTNYALVTGPGTLWPGPESRAMKDVRDDPGKTLLLVEIADSDIGWMEPRDLSLEQAVQDEGAANRLCSNHLVRTGWFLRPEQTVQFATADGWVHLLPGRFTAEGLKALATINGGEKIDLEDALVRENLWRRLDWARVVGLAVFVLSFLALTWQALRRPPRRSPTVPEPSGDQKADG